jgi:hypothetical protein
MGKGVPDWLLSSRSVDLLDCVLGHQTARLRQ